jgi:Ca2+/Na+ antiporter
VSEVTFYRCAFFLPLLLPEVGIVGIAMFPGARDSTVGSLVGLLAIGSVIGGLPYIALSIGLLWWLRAKSARAHLVATLLAPVAFAALLAICVVSFSLFEGSRHPWDAVAFYAQCALAAGYLYVLITHGLRLALMRVGLVRECPTAG